MTQHERIIEKWKDGNWRCVSEFHSITWYPWKRRAEIEKKGLYQFIGRPCEHGIEGADDWRMESSPKGKLFESPNRSAINL